MKSVLFCFLFLGAQALGTEASMESFGFSSFFRDHRLSQKEFFQLSEGTRKMMSNMDSHIDYKYKRPHLLACLEHQFKKSPNGDIPKVPKSVYYDFCSIEGWGDRNYTIKRNKFNQLNNIKEAVDVGSWLASLLKARPEVSDGKNKLDAMGQTITDEETWIKDANIFLRPFGQKLEKRDNNIIVFQIASPLEFLPSKRTTSNIKALFFEKLELGLTTETPTFDKYSCEFSASGELPIHDKETEMETSHKQTQCYQNDDEESSASENERIPFSNNKKLALISGATVAGVFIVYKFLLPGKKSKKEENCRYNQS